MAASYRYPTTSEDLSNAIIVKGIITELEEISFTPEKSVAPVYYIRTFQLTSPELIFGQNTGVEKIDAITFKGYTSLSKNTRYSDPLNFVLNFDDQSFFNGLSVAHNQEALLLISDMEFRRNSNSISPPPRVKGGRYDEMLVRVFSLIGRNKYLDHAISQIIDLKKNKTDSILFHDIPSLHPIVPLDALRIAIRHSNYDNIGYLTELLLHSSQPNSVKCATLNLLKENVAEVSQNSIYTEKLLQQLITGWEGERTSPLDKNYLEAFISVIPKLEGFNQYQLLEGIAQDYSIEEVYKLREELSKKLKEK